MGDEKTIAIGLSVPLLCAALVALFLGAPILGLTGVWGFLVQKIAFPNYLKVLHAHIAWWSVVMLISALIIPSISVKQWLKKCIVIGSFLVMPLYASLMILHYQVQDPYILNLGTLGSFYLTPFGFLGFLLEMAFFGSTLIIAFMAGGFSLPIFTEERHQPGKYELISETFIPRKTILLYAIFLFVAIILGLGILSQFTLQHKAISPAALVQFHTHVAFFAIGVLMTVIAMSIAGASKKAIDFAHGVGAGALAGTVLGFLAFIFLKFPSIVWVIPAMIYYAVLVIGWLSLWGKFGSKQFTGSQYYLRNALIFIWTALLIFSLAGPYLATRYDTSPDITVTYKQADGGIDGKHVGPYPSSEEWQGTAPNYGNPRGIENFHLSPGSWSHVAIFWLIILLLFGEKILSGLGIPNFIFFLATTIAMAPVLNSMGRIGAWIGPAVGPGALYLAGHPLKTINIVALFIVFVLWIRKQRKNSDYTE